MTEPDDYDYDLLEQALTAALDEIDRAAERGDWRRVPAPLHIRVRQE